MTKPAPVPTALSHRRVLMLAVPIILSNSSVPLVGLVDTAVMGHLPDPAYVGAVALGATVFAFLFWGFGFLRMGTTGLVAQYWGQRDGAMIRDVIARHFLLAACFGLLILLLSAPLVSLAVLLFPASEAVETAMLSYYEIRVFSAPATLANYVLMGVFVGMQRTTFALAAQLTLNLVNAALSVLLVVGWDWGIEGVATASVLAEYTALVCGLLLLRRLLPDLPGRWPVATLGEMSRYLPLLRLNRDIFIRTLCLIVSFAWFNLNGAAFGDVTLAANAILMQMIQVLAYGLDGFAHAAETLVGSAIGAGRRDQYRWAIRVTTQWAVGTALVYTSVFWLFGADFVALITSIDAVRLMADSYLPWLIAIPLISVWSYQLDGIFVGSLRTADMRNAMMVSTGVYMALSLPLIAWADNHGLWLAISLYFLLRALTLGWLLRTGQWNERAITSGGPLN